MIKTFLNKFQNNKLLLFLVFAIVTISVKGDPDVSLFNYQRFYVQNYYKSGYGFDYHYRSSNCGYTCWNYNNNNYDYCCWDVDNISSYNNIDDVYTISFRYGFCKDTKNCDPSNSILTSNGYGNGLSDGSSYTTNNSWLLSVTRTSSDSKVNSVLNSNISNSRQYKYFYQYFPTMKAKYDTAYVMFNIKRYCSTPSSDSNGSNNTPTIKTAAIKFFYESDEFLDMNGNPTYSKAWDFYDDLPDDSDYANSYKVLYIPGHPLYSTATSGISYSHLNYNPSYIRTEDYINGNLCMVCSTSYYPNY